MAFRLELKTQDVTIAGDDKPSPDSIPERVFSIQCEADSNYLLSFDGRQVRVSLDQIQNLFEKVEQHTLTEWKFSKEPEIQATFQPLNRIVSAVNSTPSYQLFLAGFHIASIIGLFDLTELEEPAIQDSFRYLVGNLTWTSGKKGRLFFLPDGYTDEEIVRHELIANGKLFVVGLWSFTQEAESMVEEKLCVPYATPIGFNTIVSPATEEAWRRINRLVSQQRPTP